VAETLQSPNGASAGRTKELSDVPEEEMPVDVTARLEPSGQRSAMLAMLAAGITYPEPRESRANSFQYTVCPGR